MATVTAAMVKELREITGAGMMECKKALTEADADIEKAIDVLRTRGLAAVQKKAGRATNEGIVMPVVCDRGTCGAIVEINCETDFVAINDKFKAYAERIASAALIAQANDVETLKAAEIDGETVEAILTDAIHVLGENIQISRVVYVQGAGVASYMHTDGKKAALVIFDVDGVDPTSAEFAQCGKDVAMQAVAMNPVAANRESVPADVLEHEKGIYVAQAAESGKPEAIQEKIAAGRLEKFLKENCLAEQAFVKDNDQTVAQYVNGVAKTLGGTMKIADFKRMQLGE